MSEPETPSAATPETSPAKTDKTPEALRPADVHPKPAKGTRDENGTPPPPPPPREPGRRGGVVAAVALILALIALAGVGALGWSWYQLRGEQARISQIAGRVSELSGQTAALANTKASVQSVTRLSEQLRDFNRDLRMRLTAVTKNLQRITSHLAGASSAYREAEAAALMRLAQARLTLAADPAGAARALELADQTLAAANDPALAPVHVALQREIAALAAVPQVDVGGAYVQLETLARRADSLPLAGGGIASPPAPASHVSPGFGWNDIGAAFKRAFSPLIVVRPGPVARPLLPPDEAYFVRQNVKLALAGAQLALLQGNAKAWDAGLRQARQWLATWYLTSDPGVKQALATLDKLAALNIAPELPSLGSALAKLAAVRAQRAAAQGAATQ